MADFSVKRVEMEAGPRILVYVFNGVPLDASNALEARVRDLEQHAHSHGASEKKMGEGS